MCGGTNLIKQGGVFVCQDCGAKYSVEEAKKMMIEGKVDVSGSTVKVDNSDFIVNYYKMAESAYASKNQEEAENYCNKIIEIDPDNYKAWLLKGRAAGWQSTLANIRLEETINCFSKAVDKAPEDEKESVKKEAADELYSLLFALVILTCNNYAENASPNNAEDIINIVGHIEGVLAVNNKFGVDEKGLMSKIAERINVCVVSGYRNDIWKDYWESSTHHPSKFDWDNYKERCFAALGLLDHAIGLGDGAEDKTIYENKIFILKELEPSASYEYRDGGWHKEYYLTKEAKQALIDTMMECHKKIKEIDPSYKIPSKPNPSSNGCYVATAVYESYDCPQVWTLRRYRDNHLALTWYGRAFIYTYYAISPTIVKWFGHTEWFKKMWRRKLDCMVKHLQDKGYESTPYQDRDWR